MLHHCKFIPFILRLVALRFEVFRKKKKEIERSPFFEMPACAVRGGHKGKSSIFSFSPVRSAQPGHWLFSHALAQVLRWQASEDELCRLVVAAGCAELPEGLLLLSFSTAGLLHACHSATGEAPCLGLYVSSAVRQRVDMVLKPWTSYTQRHFTAR